MMSFVQHCGRCVSYGSALRVVAATAGVALAGCASHTGYTKAFSGATALNGNSHRYSAATDQTFKAAKISLVQQGFTIEQADAVGGLIKGARALEDPKDKKYSYLITVSLDVTGAPAGDSTIVTASASQQTVLHKASEKYYHLLGLVPVPVGRQYQTLVRKEGNIVDPAFYTDLFSVIDASMPRAVPVSAAVATPVAAPVAVADPAPEPAAAAAATPADPAATTVSAR